MTFPRWCLPAAAAVLAAGAPLAPGVAQAPTAAQDPLCEPVAPKLSFAISPSAAKKRPVRRVAVKPRAASPARPKAAAAPVGPSVKKVVRKRRPRVAAPRRPQAA
ncbi:hypothetical protein PYV61_22690, partial [Roseisolibacter sp. H3M3-2]